MTAPSDGSAQNELQDLDRRINETKDSIRELRESISGGNAVMDAAERSAVLNNIAELEGVLDGLTRRRDAVEQQRRG